jgi:hypothetical protein
MQKGFAMQMLYNSDNFTVVQLDLPAEEGVLARGGYEIVDKFARKEIFIEGVLAEGFKAGVEALMESDPSPEDFDEFFGRYTSFAHQPLTLH